MRCIKLFKIALVLRKPGWVQYLISIMTSQKRHGTDLSSNLRLYPSLLSFGSLLITMHYLAFTMRTAVVDTPINVTGDKYR